MSIKDWKWIGMPGHFIHASYCEFHLCTEVNGFLVSTVGAWIPEAKACRILAETRGIELKGTDDYSVRCDFVDKIGLLGMDGLPESKKKYETMVFALDLETEYCQHEYCKCGLPTNFSHIPIETQYYETAGEATSGHIEMCKKYDNKKSQNS